MIKNYLNLLVESEQMVDAPRLMLKEGFDYSSVSKGLNYHVVNKLPLYDNIFRVHSDSYYNLYAEARTLLKKGILLLGEVDQKMITETDIGRFDVFEGEVVPLDSPILIEDDEYNVSSINEAEYKGKKVDLNKPHRIGGGKKKFRVYTKNDKGNVVKVEFGQPGVKIAKSAAARKSFLARHHCDSPGPKWKANYWACNIGRYKKQLGLKFPGRW
jgi:hypothetical protein